MSQRLTGKKVLILVSNGVDEATMSTVQRELLKQGATIKTVSTETGLVNSWKDNAWGLYFPVDIQIGQALGSDFDLLVCPAGERSTKKLAANPHSERIINSFMMAQKPMCMMGDTNTLPGVGAGSWVLSTDSLEAMVEHFATEQEWQQAA